MIEILLAEISKQAADSPWGSRGILLAAGMAVLAWVMLRSTRKKINRRQADNKLSLNDRVERAKKVQLMRDDIETLMAELADLSRELNGQLDTRMAKLDVLLEDADRKIRELKQLTPLTEAHPESSTSPQSPNTPPTHPEQEKCDKHHAPQDHDNAGHPAATPAPNTLHTPQTTVPDTAPMATPDSDQANKGKYLDGKGKSPPPQPLNLIREEDRQVLALYEQGADTMEIAAKLGRPRGEIELILSLSGKKTQRN